MFKRYYTLILALVLYLGLFIFKNELFYSALNNSKDFLIEMAKVLPPVMIISALISVWIPSHLVTKNLGDKSGVKGIALSFLTGALSSGPIYGAFPGVLILFKKGASIRNMTIILSSWAVIKLPMLFVESSFLGIKFTLLRFFITIPVILGISTIMNRVIKRKDIQDSVTEVTLPNLDCKSCGCDSCREFKKLVDRGEKLLEECHILKS